MNAQNGCSLSRRGTVVYGWVIVENLYSETVVRTDDRNDYIE